MCSISIIIPVFNTEIYLDKCIQSAIDQTLKQIEILIINDASTDSSLKIINNYIAKDNRITLIDFKENRGNGFGRNEGLKAAKGKYILFLDSDDWLQLNAAEEAYNRAIATSAEIVVFGHNKIFPFYSEENGCMKEFLPIYEENDPEYFRYFLQARKGIQSMPWIYLFSNEMLRANNVQFPVGVYFEDNIFVAKALLSVSRIAVLQKPALYNYRIRKGSIIQSSSKKKINDSYTVINLLKELLHSHGVLGKYKVEYTNRLLTFCIFSSFIDYKSIRRKDRDEELNSFMKEVRQSNIINLRVLKDLEKTTSIIKAEDGANACFMMHRAAVRLLPIIKKNYRLFLLITTINGFISASIYNITTLHYRIQQGFKN